MIEKLYLNAVGCGVLITLLYVLWKTNARRWSRLARAYRAHDKLQCTASECCPTRSMQTVILVGGDIGWNSYKGIATVGVTAEGILLRLMPPFHVFHPPLLIPFRDSHIEPKRWYLIGKTAQFTLSQVSDVQIIVHDELLQWIESQATQLAVTSP
ncbi:hypothetical protein Pla52o_15100 [Novipirellula galeiformis]|uniref:Uncharacterized protein n=1 Tax=Novipirellula galeiformis TaxID=2528004 RepID=A0A5C6CLJ5_9BACT|nr:hypothetical protein [Novipirellula galeiformis]TWU25212.1 hypothetical protein Pla52o_15100 [Novipirellula galeiformis]